MSYYYVGADGVGNTPIGDMRTEARLAAQLAGGVFTLVWYKKDGTTGVKKFANHDELMDAYGQLADDQVTYNYVAAYSQDPVLGLGPLPVQEFGEAIKTGVVRESPDRPIASQKSSGIWGWLLAGIAATLGAIGLSKKGKRYHV